MRNRIALLIAALGLIALLMPASAMAGAPRLLKLGDFSAPVDVAAPPGDPNRLFVVEQEGVVRVLSSGKTLKTPFLDLRSRVKSGGEQGLLSIGFPPDYSKSRRFYVYYTDAEGDIRVEEFKRSKDSKNRADASSRRLVIEIQHRLASNHNGGDLVFGPDKLLYFATGDGGGGGDPQGNAQNLNSLLGKMIRIDPRRNGSRRYRIPSSNPFVGRSGRDEVYAYGLRNPFRFSFDSKTGDLTIGDVGQSKREEVDFVPRADGGGRGANFGWNCFEGTLRFSGCSAGGHVEPVIERETGGSDGDCAVIGGFVVRDPRLDTIAGQYVYGDSCNRNLRVAKLDRPRAREDRQLGLAVPGVSAFAETDRGCLYAVSLEGPVYRLAGSSSKTCK